MGIFNALKNLFKPEQLLEIETIELGDVRDWIVKNKADLEIINSQFVSSIKEIIGSFSTDFSLKIEILEQVDLDKFKIEERGRKIVEENYKNYLDHLRRLKNDLEEIKIVDSILAIDEIYIVFENFEKKSNLNFQKASILIGNELGAVRESIGQFSRDIKKLIDSNKDYLKKNEVVVLVGKNLEEIEEYRFQGDNIRDNLKASLEGIDLVKKDIDNLDMEIKNVRDSEAYIHNTRMVEKLEGLRIKHDKLIYSLKNMINFKGLSNFFHVNKNDMDILNKFKSNFKDNYYENSDEFISLLNESKMINLETQDIINGIKDIKDEMSDINVGGDETDELTLKINREKIGIGNYEVQTAKDNKKLIKIQENIIVVEKHMIEKLREVNVEVLGG